MKLKRVISLIIACMLLTLISGVVFGASKAKISQLSGKVRVMKAGGEKAVEATTGMVLEQGDRIMTGKNSAATLQVNENQEVKVDENTFISFNELLQSAGSDSDKTKLGVASGKVFVNIKKKLNVDAKFEIKTPTAVMGVRGTQFFVQNADGNTVIAVLEGVVSITRTKITVDPSGKVSQEKKELILNKNELTTVTEEGIKGKEATDAQKLDLFLLQIIKEEKLPVDQSILNDIDKIIQEKIEEKAKKQAETQTRQEAKPHIEYENQSSYSNGDKQSSSSGGGGSGGGGGGTSTNPSSDNKIKSTGISLDKTTVNLEVGQSEKVTATISPDNATNKGVTYESSNSQIARVDASGNITGVHPGTAQITVISQDNNSIKAICTVVVKVKVTGISLDKTTVNLEVGQGEKVTATIIPDNATNKGVTYESSDTNIATVNESGNITGVHPGTAQITAISQDNNSIKAICNVVVKLNVKATGISLDKNTVNLEVGQGEKVTATITPQNATNIGVTYESSDTNIATVNASGNITGVHPGTAQIIAISQDNNSIKAICNVVVKVKVTGIVLDKTTVNLEVGQSEKVTATITPNNATNTGVTYESSGTNIATVNAAGNITAVNAGTAQITAISQDNNSIKAICNVVVKVKATGISLDKTTVNLEVGQGEKVTATISPNNATNKGVTYESSDTNIATVNASGNITGVHPGTAQITAISQDNNSIKAICNVVVKLNVKATGISLDKTTVNLEVGQGEKVTATIIPDNATNKVVTYESSNTQVATVDASGNITGVQPGTAQITAISQDNNSIKAICNVVVKVKVTGISLDKTTVNLEVGQGEKVTATIIPDNATNKGVTYESSDTNIATVNAEGNITGVHPGTAQITVISQDNNTIKAICNVVVKLNVKATGIALDKTTVNLEVGQGEKVTATISPDSATNKGVTYESSDTNIATVNASGNITGVQPGTAQITAISQDNNSIKAVCNVVVKVKVTGISLDKTTVNLEVGQGEKVTATISPDSATNKGVTYESSDPNIATVNASGNITAVNAGTAQITAISQDNNSIKAICNVVVKVKVTGISLDKTTVNLEVGQGEKVTATISPNNATNRGVTYESSNTQVATVDAVGNITGIKSGTAQITAISQDNNSIKAICNVVVKLNVKATGISLDKTTVNLEVGQGEKVTATIIPDNATNKGVTYESSDTNIATVNASGNITGVQPGTAQITAISQDNNSIKAICTVVVKVKVTGIALDKTTVNLEVGQGEKVTATIIPNNATNTGVTYESSDTNIATVNAVGNITAVNAGTAQITAISQDNNSIKAVCDVVVNVKVTGIVLDKTTVNLEVGQSEKVTATISPDNATNKGVTYESSNTQVATVDAVGNITGIKSGTAQITAISQDNNSIKAICNVVVKLNVKATAIALDKTTVNLEVGQGEKVTATISPDSATNRGVTYESSNTQVATVNTSGNITGVQPGTAQITAISQDNNSIKAICNVVVKVKAMGIALDKTAVNLEVGQNEKVTATISPDNATNKGVTYESSDTNIATVNAEGNITGVHPGTAQITAISQDNNSIKEICNVVVKVKVTAISLDKTTVNLEVGQGEKVTATISPDNATNDGVTYTSSDTNIATVNASGNITGVQPGTAQITAISQDNNSIKAICNVVVKVKVTGIALDKTTANLEVGQDEKVTATISPNNATNKGVTYESSNSQVATVDASGNITGVHPGTAQITAISQDNNSIKAICNVVVKVKATGIALDKTTVNLEVGQGEKVTATISPDSATNKGVTYESSNSQVATVDASGNITGVHPGTAQIIAISQDNNSIKAICNVVVKVKVTGISLDKTTVNLEVGQGEKVTATISPQNATNKLVTYTSSDTNIATVDSEGNITSVSGGTANISAISIDDNTKVATCTVIVKVNVEGITLDSQQLTLAVGEKIKLKATISPDNATNDGVTYTSSDHNIATVDDNGKITAVGVGEVIISAISKENNDIMANCTVIVKIKVLSITLDETTMNLGRGQSAIIIPTINPNNATDKSVSYESSDSSIVSVDQDGKVKGIRQGIAVITVISNDDRTIKATCTITVYNDGV